MSGELSILLKPPGRRRQIDGCGHIKLNAKEAALAAEFIGENLIRDFHRPDIGGRLIESFSFEKVDGN